MTPKKCMETLIEVDEDVEDSHKKADDALCDLLIYLGYEEVVEQYLLIGKWYA